MNKLGKIIKETTGKKLGEFCQTELKTQYTAFFWRLQQGKLYPDEIFYIVWRTKKPIEELFGKPWQKLWLDNSGGPVVKDVEKIIGKMSVEELSEIQSLLGWDKNRKLRQKAHTPPKKKDHQNTKYPLTEKDAVQPEEPKKDDEEPFTLINLY